MDKQEYECCKTDGERINLQNRFFHKSPCEYVNWAIVKSHHFILGKKNRFRRSIFPTRLVIPSIDS